MSERNFQKKERWGEHEKAPLLKTQEEYNELLNGMLGGYDLTGKFMNLLKSYKMKEPDGGCLQTLFNDGNVDECSIDYARGFADACNDWEAKDIAHLMKLLKIPSRKRMVDIWARLETAGQIVRAPLHGILLTKGSLAVCVDNAGITNKLTIGKEYSVVGTLRGRILVKDDHGFKDYFNGNRFKGTTENRR